MSEAPVAENTFRSYDQAQSQAYANLRFNYDDSVYDTIINHHVATGGQLNTVLDVGCGPGIATRSLAPRFAHAIGLDPGQSMISTAQSLGGTSSTSEPIQYSQSQAEELGSNLSAPIEDHSIDLITAATAAHWFDMPSFWRRAAQVLKPGGTVALWASGPIRVDPATPNASRIQAALDRLDSELLEDYMLPGNLIVRRLYADLPLPWAVDEPIQEFERASFLRKEWNTGPDYAEEKFYAGKPPESLRVLEAILSTSSPVTRWRQANAKLVNTEQDPVKITTAEIRAALSAAGVEHGEASLKGSPKAVLLMVKKQSKH